MISTHAKKGVSLVTVLMFMMVATIAATATYKWLSSAGSSSASRMKLNAARELAVSGIEATRSWMEYNGNDVGAVIKQYFDNEGKPILLNPVLSRKFTESNQDSVWLVGVSPDRQNYKLKILSVGTLDANTKYSEVAIMNVGGLFQVSLPTTGKKVNLSEAFHGALGSADSIIVDAAVIKQQPAFTKYGNQLLNGIRSSKYLVLDGSFYVNSKANVKDLYVTGDLDFGYDVTASGNMYVGGNLYGSTPSNSINVSGSAYIKGDFKPEEKSEYVKKEVQGYEGTRGGKFRFGKNLTILGNLEHFANNTNDNSIDVESNLVVMQKLKIKSDDGSLGNIRVMGNAYIDGYELAPNAKLPLVKATRTYLGASSDDKKVYIGGMAKKNTTICEGYKCAESSKPEDEIYIAYQGSFGTISPTEYDLWKADSLPQYAQKISEKETSGECSDIAKSPIQFNKQLFEISHVRTKDKPMGCDEGIWNDNSGDNYVDLINACYDIAFANGSLHDKNWLILDFDGLPGWIDTQKRFSKNIVLRIRGTIPSGGFNLPRTTKDANVVLYFPDGWKNKEEGQSIRTMLGGEDTDYRYFIYSAGDIGLMQVINNAKGITGAIFMEGCSVFNSLGKSAHLVAEFDKNMVDLLASANIICNNDGSGVCTGFTAVATEYVGGAVYSSVDEFYISTSPQLSILIESQYRNTENIARSEKDFAVVQPSAVVLPRVVYLTQDPLGKLSDYYNVLGVNGSKQTKNAAKMSCPPGINSGDQLLYDKTNLLPEGKYICTYEEAAQKSSIPLFVVVEGLLNESPDIYFEKENIPLSPGSSKMVSLVFQGEGTFTALIKAPSSTNMPYGWNPIEPQAGVTIESETGAYTTYKVTGSGFDTPIPVFRVSAGEYAEKSDVHFQLEAPCKGCKITKPDVATVSISSVVEVNRIPFTPHYCSTGDNAKTFKEKNGVECNEAIERPKCELDENTEWVRAKGCRIAQEGKNNKWYCNTNDMGETYLENKIPNNKECDVFIADTTVKLSSSGDTYYLPAELKRKMHKFYLKFVKNNGASVKIDVKRSNAQPKDTTCFGDCSLNLFVNDTVYTTLKDKDSDKFSYWSCKGEDCGIFANKTNTADTSKIIITDVDTITYHFNETDEHCFYDDFSKTQEKWCGNNEEKECFDYCKSGDKCKIGQGHYNGAKWFIPQKNKTSGFYYPEVNGGKMRSPKKNVVICGFPPKQCFDFNGNHPTVVLNTANAGYNGQMTTLFEVATATSQGINKLLNRTIDDGFIFRSNDDASEYFLLNIISGCEGLSCHTRAKICQTGGLDGNKNAPCDTASFKSGLTGNSKIHESKIGRSSLNVDIKDDIVTITLSHSGLGLFSSVEEHRPAVAQIDLNEKFSKNLYNDEDHSRVGLKFDVPLPVDKIIDNVLDWIGLDNFSMSFAAYDFGWKSYTYNESCWDTPSVLCSFKSNYAGGMVPKDSLVTPWVGMSSWFETNGKKCKVTYYYNGCDLEDDLYADGFKLFGYSFAEGDRKMACNLTKDIGFYRWHARELDDYNRGKLKGENYIFQDEGYHGYPSGGLKMGPIELGPGTVKEASVIVNCSGGTSEDRVRMYDASCGDFIVGTFEECSESYSELLKGATNRCSDDNLCELEWNEDYINARGAKIYFSVSELTQGEVSVYLMSEEGIMSEKAFTITESGDYEIDVSQVSDVAGFNPQKVKSLVFDARGTNGFNVTHIHSNCPNVLGLTCKGATYDVAQKEWVVKADVNKNSEKANKCKVKPLHGKLSTLNLGYEDCVGLEQHIPQDDVYGQSTEQDYSFRVVAYDAQGKALDSCETIPFTAPEFNLTCNVSRGNVNQGTGLPSLTYSMQGCPEDGCPHELTFPNDSIAKKTGTSYSGLCPEGGCNNYNIVNATRDDKWNQGTYSYMVNAYGNYCKAEFEILPEPPKASCKDSKARIEDGKFVADVIYDTEQHSGWKGDFVVEVSGNFIIADPLGNVLMSEEIDSEDPHYEKALTSNMATCNKGWCKYIAVLKLYGGELCATEWVKYAQMNELGCPTEPFIDKSHTDQIVLLDTLPDCAAVSDLDEIKPKCNWFVERGFKEIASGTNYKGGELAFSGDGGVVGKKDYKLTVVRLDSINETTIDTSKKSCDFSVVYDNTDLKNECGFVDNNNNVQWGGRAQIWLTSNCENCPYKVITPSGKEWASGYTSGTEYEKIQLTLESVVELGSYKIYINGDESKPCEIIPSMATIDKQECKLDKTVLTSGQKTFMTTKLPCENDACRWNYELEKDGVKFKDGVTGSNVEISDLEVGQYRFRVNGDFICDFEITKGKDCYFDKSIYNYNEQFKFIVEDVNAKKIDYYTFKDQKKKFGSVYEGTQFSVTGNATSPGTYTFSGGGKQCSDELKVTPPTIKCERKKTTERYCSQPGLVSCKKYSERDVYYLELTATGCQNKCEYKVYKNSSSYSSATGKILTALEKVNNVSSTDSYTVKIGDLAETICTDAY